VAAVSIRALVRVSKRRTVPRTKMTNYEIHRKEQLDAAWSDFQLTWAWVIALDTHRDTPGQRTRAWVEFLKTKNLLNPKPPKKL
jgi:hypothetical protein